MTTDKVYTLRECVDVFKDDLGDMLPVKLASLDQEIQRLTTELQGIRQVTDMCLEREIQLGKAKAEDRDIYMLMANEFYHGDKYARLQALEKEQRNITNAYKIYRVSMGADKRELPKIALAKDYPIDEVYRGDLRKYGNKLAGVCPFHSEKTGSFFLFLDTNRFHCFGCGADGDVIDLYMRVNGCSFAEAVDALSI